MVQDSSTVTWEQHRQEHSSNWETAAIANLTERHRKGERPCVMDVGVYQDAFEIVRN